MYLVLFLDTQHENYEFISSLHSSLPKAKAAYEALVLRFGVDPLVGDYCGNEPHVYRIECDGNPGKGIDVSDDDLAAA